MIPNMNKSNYFKLKEIRYAETICIKALNHKMDYYSPFHFIEFFIHNGFIFSSTENISKIYTSIYDTFRNLVKDDIFIEYNPIEIAITCILYNLDKQRANDFLEIYNIKESEYRHCLDHLKG